MGNTTQTALASVLTKGAPKAAPWSLSGSKRLFDICSAIMLCSAAAPIMIMLALAVKASSRGPVVFRQNRVGRNGKEFPVLKFRTMYSPSGNSSGPLITRSGDSRVTPVGRWLRKWKLDELPQLVNVLMGDMSLVGHRPDMLKYVQTLSGQDRKIMYFCPGITSPASVRFRNEEQELAKVPVEEMEHLYVSKLLPQKVRMDLEYAEHATFASDCRILLRTAFLVLGRGRG
jgi:lipopolysaccharide/colanic/teichoic acid biosynthesis glycosyltransferase